MKHIKQSYPRRRDMLSTPFGPLSDSDFRELVASGQAIPGQQGGLFVSKWSDGPRVNVEEFLVALRAAGSTLEVRRFKTDANVRVVRSKPSRGGLRNSAVISEQIRA
jgi:hypothetical protein